MPAAQLEHWLAPARENAPASQLAHEEEPSRDAVPPPHARQLDDAVAPVVGRYLPATQPSQLAEAVFAWYDPAAQLEQELAPAAE